MRFSNSTKRILKKYLKYIYHDGQQFSIEDWTKLLNRVNQLKIGDKIHNPYTNKEDIIKKIVIQTNFITNKYWVRDYFRIETETNYWIYDL